jgi:hypothetical protein
MSVTINASTSSGLVQTADTSGTVEIQSNGTTKFNVASTGAYGQLVSGTAVASTSGTSIDFTGIPSWVKRITVMFQGVSTNAASDFLVQLGSGSVTTSGYLGASSRIVSTAAGTANSTAGFFFNYGQNAAQTMHGNITLTLLTGNTWTGTGQLSDSNTSGTTNSGGSVTLSGVCDRVRITTANGTQTFDAGTINIQYEG